MNSFQERYTTRDFIGQTEGGHGGCPGCAVAQSLRYVSKAMDGKGLFVVPPGCTPVVVMSPKFNADFTVQVSLFGTTPALASGLSRALKIKGDTTTEVVAWGGDGATFDIGFQSLSGAAERNEDLLYVCSDNEAYQNTGNQRSSATPKYGVSSTNPLPAVKTDKKKDISKIMAEHGIPYLATASVAYPEDLMNKVRKARKIKGFKFIHIMTPCTTGWQFRSEQTIEIARMAVQSGMFPLYEVENGVNYTLNLKPSKRIPVKQYLRLQKRYTHVSLEEMEMIQADVDERWRRIKWLTTYE